MALQSSFYNTDGTTRTYPSTKHIATKQHVSVYGKRVSDSTWVVLAVDLYELVNNSIVFDSAPDTLIYSQIEVRVADTANELEDSPSDIAIVASIAGDITAIVNDIENVDTVATNIGAVNIASANNANITTVAGSIANVNTVVSSISNVNVVATNIANVNSVASDIVPNLDEILQADTNAINAAASASAAANSANNAYASASNAATSEANALTYANSINPSLLVAKTTYDAHVPLSGVTSYHLLSGNLALENTVITNGFATTLYTGNGTTQSIVTGVDMATQWGNLASETYGGLVWLKGRSGATNNFLYDTIRGATNEINTNTAEANAVLANSLTAFSSTGFSVGSDAGHNTNTATYASWVFQTTHRITGTTNHGKPYTCHYNPFTGFTIVKYEGSGIAGHEIPHHLGRKLGFVTGKNLTDVINWMSSGTEYSVMAINTTSVASANTYWTVNENSLVHTSVISEQNASTKSYILYGWANSYFDEANTLIGNYEVGVCQSDGASGNKIPTRGKPAWIMLKRLDSTSGWNIYDNKRGTSFDNGRLQAEGSYIENTSNDDIDVFEDGFDLKASTSYPSGGQYLYMVVYDNDSGSGKSKYPKPSDTTNLNINNAIIPFANGLDANGAINSTLSKNETISGLTFTEGKNYVYGKSDGTYGTTPHEPMYGSIRNRTYATEAPEYFNIAENKWYTTTGHGELVTNGTFDTDVSGWTAVNSTLSVSNSTLKVTNSGAVNGQAYQVVNTEIGKTYKFKFKFSLGTSLNVGIRVGTAIFNGDYVLQTYSASTIGEFTFVAKTTTTYITFQNESTNNGYNYFDDISMFLLVPTISTATTHGRNYLNAIVYADQNGQPTYVEQLPKTQYFDEVKANDFKGKNACTAWVNFDGTTTPPTIRDSYNVKAVIRTATGVFDVYFEKEMDSASYSISGSHEATSSAQNGFMGGLAKTVSKTQIVTTAGTAAVNPINVSVQVFGGKNV